MNTTKDVMALTKGDMKAGDRAFGAREYYNWWGSKADHARTKKPHRPNDERKKFYYIKY